jgi:hypothetical protein
LCHKRIREWLKRKLCAIFVGNLLYVAGSNDSLPSQAHPTALTRITFSENFEVLRIKVKSL